MSFDTAEGEQYKNVQSPITRAIAAITTPPKRRSPGRRRIRLASRRAR